MSSRKLLNLLPTALAAATALLYLTGNAYSASQRPGPVVRAAATFVAPHSGMVSSAIGATMTGTAKPAAHNADAEARTEHALDALASGVRQLSHPAALRDAFQSYFAFESEHPDEVRKPYLYFVDYGLTSSTPRGYVFDMNALRIVDGPFMVAQGRGSAANAHGIPTRFSNSFGAATTSLGLYVAQELYQFTGHAGGAPYHSIGLRLAGVSGNFNNNARARGVVAHGAPYVTATRAGDAAKAVPRWLPSALSSSSPSSRAAVLSSSSRRTATGWRTIRGSRRTDSQLAVSAGWAHVPVIFSVLRAAATRSAGQCRHRGRPRRGRRN